MITVSSLPCNMDGSVSIGCLGVFRADKFRWSSSSFSSWSFGVDVSCIPVASTSIGSTGAALGVTVVAGMGGWASPVCWWLGSGKAVWEPWTVVRGALAPTSLFD